MMFFSVASWKTARFTSGTLVAATTRKLPVRSPAAYSRRCHSTSPAAARSVIRSVASGAITVTFACAACSDSILDSAKWPAPMTMQGRAAIFRNMGKRSIAIKLLLLARRVVAGSYRWSVALNRIDDGAVELRPQAVVVRTRKVRPQVFIGLPVSEIRSQKPLDGRGYVLCGSAVAQRTGCARIFANRSANAEVEGIHESSILLDLLALESNVGDPVLSAGVGAARHVQLDLLVKARQPILHLADQPLGEALRLRNSQLAELGARARDGSAPECRHIHLQPQPIQLNKQSSSLRTGNVDDQDVLHDRRTQLTIAILLRQVTQLLQLIARQAPTKHRSSNCR